MDRRWWKIVTNEKASAWMRVGLVAFLSLALVGCDRNAGLLAQGYVEGKYTYLASAVSGTLAQLLVERGTAVVAGQLVFTLDPEPEASQKLKAKNELARAEQELVNLQKGERATILQRLAAQRAQVASTLDLAKKTLVRYQFLYKSHTVSKATLDQATDDYQANVEKLKEFDANLAEAQLGARENAIAAQAATVEADKAAVRQADWALAQKNVRAPMVASVFDTLHEVGEFVATGQAVAVLLPKSSMKVIFFVPENKLALMRTGKKVAVGCDSCGAHTRYAAQISFISDAAEYTPPVIFSRESKDKLVYRIEAKLDDVGADALHFGQPVDVYIAK